MGIEVENLNDFMDFLLGDTKEDKPKDKNEKYYECCDRFYGKEKLVCENIKKLRQVSYLEFKNKPNYDLFFNSIHLCKIGYV